MLTDNEVLEIWNLDSTANDPQVFELEKEYTENFTKTLTVGQIRDILARTERA